MTIVSDAIMKHVLLILTIALSHLACGPSNASDPTPPNILVFVADDAGWRDFGCYGHPTIRTPNIDALAAAGLVMDRAFLTSPQCSPSRTSMLAGAFAHTLGTEDLHTPLPDDVRIVPWYLDRAGYHTGLIRKSHIGEAALEQFHFFRQSNDSSQLVDFQDFLDAAGNKPFFMWYAFIDPHRGYGKNIVEQPHTPDMAVVPPYLADTENTRRDLARYYDEITRLDRCVGEAIGELRARKLFEKTLVIFLTDNGKPFTRAKGTLYDEGTRTPLIFHWPDEIRESHRSDLLISVIHLAPTFLDLAGVEIPQSMVGRSLLPLLQGKRFEPDKYVFAERNWHDCDEHMRAVRSDTFKLIKNAYIEWPHGTAADLAGSPSHQDLLRLKRNEQLNDAQSLIFDVPRPVIELYNVIEDPYELNNLAWYAEYRPVVKKLHKALLDWMETTDDFPPEQRRRHDRTDRVTGTDFHFTRPPAYRK